MTTSSVSFTYLLDSLTADAEVREKIKDAVKVVEKDERECLAVLNRVHVLDGPETLVLLDTLTPLLAPLRTSISALAALVPPTQFYRFNDFLLSRVLQSASFIVVFDVFLRTEEVASKADVSAALGISDDWSDHFFLTIEEYLHSLISLLNELSRLAVNRVTLGDFGAPVRFARFAKEVSTAFGLLNLKNDSLRKRFDGIKYDVKKLEEVVYDLSLRGLLVPEATNGTTTTTRGRDQEGGEGQGPAKRAKAEEGVQVDA